MLDLFLILTHLFIVAGAVAGVLYLKTNRAGWHRLFAATAWGAIASQSGWLAAAGFEYPYCVLLDAWGMMAFVVLMGIGVPLWAEHRYHMPRLPIATLVLLFTAIVVGRLVFPPAGTSVSAGSVDTVLSVHIFLVVVGYATLLVGCVTGILFLIRSHTLKGGDLIEPDVPWPSLTAIDGLFVRSTGWGILILVAGIVFGATAIPESAASGESWYADPKILLTTIGFLVYGAVLLIRKRQGFCSRIVVGLGTVGFICILLGFFAAGILNSG